MVVGGDGNPRRARQVVASASYEARAVGVRSGMPLSAALRQCPDAVFLPTDHAAYEAASATVMDTLRGFPVRVEVWGWDEAYFGGDIADPHALAVEVRAAVLAASGLSASIGIGHNKQQAKIAAQFAKPGGAAETGGVFEITAGNWMRLMAARSVSALFGVGPRTAKKLDDLGLHTVADLAAADPAVLLPVFGPRMAPWHSDRSVDVVPGGGAVRELAVLRLPLPQWGVDPSVEGAGAVGLAGGTGAAGHMHRHGTSGAPQLGGFGVYTHGGTRAVR